MAESEYIEHKLLEVLRKRNSRLLFPHLILLFTSIYIFRGMFNDFPQALVVSGIIVVALILRLFVLQIWLKQDSKNKLFETMYLSMVSLTGLGWGGLFWSVNQFFGDLTFETLFCGGVIVTLISGGVTAFSASLKTVTIYLFSLTAIPVFVLFTDPSESAYLIGILLLANLFYQFYHSYISHNYLRDSLLKEYKTDSQRKALQELIDAFPGIVTVINKAGKYILVNNFSDGFFKTHLLDKSVGETFPDSSIPKVLLDFLKSDKAEEILEVKSNDQGHENWYMVNLKRITSPEEGIIAAILSINELAKAKNDLKIQEARAQYASKLASLGELSAGIAHEVNNPLTIIEGTASLMKVLLTESPLDEKTLEKSVGKILATTQRIARIIKGLRMLAKDAEEEPFRNIKFLSIVEPCLEISKSKLLGHQIQFSVINHDKNIDLFGNEIQLSQVMMNLVSNAIDAAVLGPEPRWIEIQYKPSYEWTDILVIDSGNGVSEEISSKIMDPFFTTKETHQGTGLGLSISKKIIESHHGTLSLMTEMENTTFRVRLPRMTPWSES